MSAAASPYQPDAPAPLANSSVEQARQMLASGPLAILTGAGCSTESGIPDYRGPKTPNSPGRRLVHYHPFVHDAAIRQRYWARTYIGWPRIADAAPNRTHLGLQAMESRFEVRGLVTQNVDGLHHKARSANVVELHGTLHRVRCLQCNRRWPRAEIQEQIARENDTLLESVDPTNVFADGDAAVDEQFVSSFLAPTCRHCAGALKPDVVFFGENIPDAAKQDAETLVDDLATLMIVGSSLHVPSARRLVTRALHQRAKVMIVNVGSTWADDKADLLLPGLSGNVIPTLAQTP